MVKKRFFIPRFLTETTCFLKKNQFQALKGCRIIPTFFA
jgi:hypothetical protein